MLKHLTALGLSLLLAACTSDPTVPKYAGTDAGYLAIALGASHQSFYGDYMIYFRKADGSADQRVWYGPGNNTYLRRTDFDGPEGAGIVELRPLAPGNYEIYDFALHSSGGFSEDRYSAKHDFSLPFTIKTGRVTYLGQFMAIELFADGLFGKAPAGGLFAVGDQGARDLSIVHKQRPDLTQIDTTVPDVRGLHSPFFVPANTVPAAAPL
jgi:hypothetical protein